MPKTLVSLHGVVFLLSINQEPMLGVLPSTAFDPTRPAVHSGYTFLRLLSRKLLTISFDPLLFLLRATSDLAAFYTVSTSDHLCPNSRSLKS